MTSDCLRDITRRRSSVGPVATLRNDLAQPGVHGIFAESTAQEREPNALTSVPSRPPKTPRSEAMIPKTSDARSHAVRKPAAPARRTRQREE